MLSLSTRLALLPAFELSDCNAFYDSRMFRFAWGEHFSALTNGSFSVTYSPSSYPVHRFLSPFLISSRLSGTATGH